MEIKTGNNSATVLVHRGEKFFFKNAILTGFREFEWCIWPPFPTGCPISRIIHKCYFNMKRVEAQDRDWEIPVIGYHPRGTFFSLYIPKGEHRFVNAKNLVGFSSDLASIHTHIKFQLSYWCLREHFFPVFEGPGTVLIYSRSSLEQSTHCDFSVERIVSFNIDRRFTPMTPKPKSAPALIYNVLSEAVIWHFVDPGETIVETHQAGAEGTEKISIKELFWHCVGFLKF